MQPRNLSPQAMFQAMARERTPSCAFDASDQSGFEAWRADAYPRVMQTLGAFPEPVAPNPECIVEWQHDGLTKQRWLIDVSSHLSAVVQVNYPPGPGPDEKRPVILCWHGHGDFGMEPVMGNDGAPGVRENMELHNYGYGHTMAKAGFVTFATEWLGRGCLADSGKPHWLSLGAGNDWCNIYYLHATMLGMTSISINLAHGKAATDFVAGLPHVDAQRLGVMGLSGGGTMTLWTALYEPRIRATEIICYSDLWPAFGFRDVNYCGMQVAPGLYALVDLPDLQGLLAPKPLLVDIGVQDECFRIDTALPCYRKVERIYAAAGAAEHLELDLFPGPHSWGGNRSDAFFRRHLDFPTSA